MKMRRITVQTALFILLTALFWLIPSEGFSEDRRWPRFYIEPSFTFLDRDIDEDSFTANGHFVPSTPTNVQSDRLLMQIGAELTPNVELYGLVGGSNLTISDFDFNSDLVTAYGGGARLRLYPYFYRPAGVVFFLDYHFLTYKAKDENVVFDPTDVNGIQIFPPSGVITRERITWREHVVKVGVSSRHAFFEPYGGFRLSFLDTSDKLLDVPGGQLNLHIREDQVFGLFAGTYIYLDPRESTAFFAEANIIDENSIKLGFRVNF